MTCADHRPLLDDYVDGGLDPARSRELESHLARCGACREELAALRAIVTEARTLPRTIAPPRDLFGGIAARLPATRPRSPARLQRPLALLAAALFLLIAGATLATRYQRGREAPMTAFAREQARYARATAELARRLADDPAPLSATTRAVVERNLAIVDAAIREAEHALASDPGNTELEQMVLARYAQRLALLKHATDAGRRES